MRCTQRSHLRAQLGVTVQGGRKELIISIAAEAGGLLGVVGNSLGTGKPPGSREEVFPGDRPCLCPSDNRHFCLDAVTEEERGDGEGDVEKTQECGGY